ncbi:MAG TPA: FecR domain-containing protein [Steroidobacter sp.]
MDSNNGSEKAAAAWLARRVGENWTDSDEAVFNQWLHASTRNRVAFIRVNAAWREADRLKALGAGLPTGATPAPGEWQLSPFFDTPQPAKLRRKLATRWQAIAACSLLGVLGIAGYLWPTGPSYRTPIGGVARVPIADGSNVTLNTDSRIRVVLTDTERHVEIERGEAFFEVAKDAARPFVVSAGNKRVVAVGTKFSVRRDGEDVRVVVTEGRVRVEGDSTASAPPTQLGVGDVATASVAGVLVQQKPLPVAEEYLSWRSGYLVFRDRALADAVNEFNRYNTRQLVIDDPTVATLRIGGNFRATNVDGFARLLEQGYPVSVERRDDGAVLAIRAQSH